MKVTFAFRGGNPFMSFLVDRFTTDGWNVETRVVPQDTSPELCKDPDEVAILIGDLSDAVVVTDKTIHRAVNEWRPGSIDAYSAIERPSQMAKRSVEELLAPVRAVVEEIRLLGRQPVVLPVWLGAHLYLNEDWPEGLSNRADDNDAFRGMSSMDCGNGEAFAQLLYEELGLPLISSDYFLRYDRAVSGDIRLGLSQLKISTDDAVLLVDHHVRDAGRDNYERRGLFSVEMVTICPCCVGLGGACNQNLSELGFRLLPLKYKRDFEPAVERLKDMIQRASIA